MRPSVVLVHPAAHQTFVDRSGPSEAPSTGGSFRGDAIADSDVARATATPTFRWSADSDAGRSHGHERDRRLGDVADDRIGDQRARSSDASLDDRARAA